MTLPFTTVSAVILQYELSLEWTGTQVVFLQLEALLLFNGSAHYPLADSP
jgi:hypothetical protein